MRSLDFTSSRRLARVATGTLAIGAVVACSDDTTAPRPAAAAIQTTGVMESIRMTTLVTVAVKPAGESTLLPDTAFLRFIVGDDSIVVGDNSVHDKNKTTGLLAVVMPWAAHYTVCLNFDTKNYAIQPGFYNCSTVAGGANTVDAGILRMRKFPLVAFSLQDASGSPITEGEMKLDSDYDAYVAIVEDGGVGDRSPAVDGKVVVRANRPGWYTWCETVAPTGYLKTYPSCGSIELNWEQTKSIVLKHAKKITIQPQF